MSETDFSREKEYYALFDNIKDFDQRLITIKGWAVTLSLVSIGAGFKESHYGIFLVALLSGIAFWLIEGTIKRHQMRHYLRMRQIEADNFSIDESGKYSTPLIDWSWRRAPFIYAGKEIPQHLKQPSVNTLRSYTNVWIFPHVFLPHVISVLAGGILFLLGCVGKLGMPL